MGLPAPLTLGNPFMGSRAPLDTARPELTTEQKTADNPELAGCETASDAFLGSRASLNTCDAALSPQQNNTAGDAFMGSRAPLDTGRPGRAKQESWYGWGIVGHDLASIYADQTDNYFAVMSSTALPATELDMRDRYRGPMDTVLEEIPEAVLYETYPEEREDEARRQEIDLAWADEAFGKHTAQTFDEIYYLLPSSDENPTFLELAESFVTEPEVTFVTDAKGKTVPMATALIVVRDIQGKGTGRVLKALLDTGGSSSMASVSVLPPGTVATSEPIEMVSTLAGHMTTEGSITMTGLRLPEFD